MKGPRLLLHGFNQARTDHVYWALASLLMIALVIFTDHYIKSIAVDDVDVDVSHNVSQAPITEPILHLQFTAVSLPEVPHFVTPASQTSKQLPMLNKVERVPPLFEVDAPQPQPQSQPQSQFAPQTDMLQLQPQTDPQAEIVQAQPALKSELAQTNDPKIEAVQFRKVPAETLQIEATSSKLPQSKPAQSTSIEKSPSIADSVISQQQIQTVLQALSNAQLQIAMPRSFAARQRVLNYLYKCVGIGLAALYQQGDANQLMPLTTMPGDPSSILRSISGEISVYERNLGAAYAPNSNLIRVYPMAVDVALSTHIARHLNGRALSQFFAEYQLKQGRLSVTNIRINDVELEQTWLIFNGVEKRCGL